MDRPPRPATPRARGEGLGPAMGGGSGLAASASTTCPSTSAEGRHADAPSPDPVSPRRPRRAVRLRGGALFHWIWPRCLCLRRLSTGKRAMEGRGSGPAAARKPVADAPVDWCRLPEELLVAVMAELEVADLVRAAAACSSWRAAFTAFRRLRVPSPKQPPFLLYSDRDDPDVAVFRVPTPSSKSAAAPPIRAALPGLPLSRLTFVGSAYGWLVTADQSSNLHVVNPLTGAQVALPPLATLHNVESSTGDGGDPTYRIFTKLEDADTEPAATLAAAAARETMYCRAILSCSPSAGAACIVLLLHWPDGELSFTRLGDERWTSVSAVGHAPLQRSGYRDALYDSDSSLFYVMRLDSSIYTLDLNGESPSASRIFLPSVTVMYDPGLGHVITMYLVRAPSGDLLQVCRQIAIHVYPIFSPPRGDGDYELARRIETCDVRVYMVDLHGQKLEQITTLGDHSLFLGYNNSMCISTIDLPMLKPNHGYLTDSCYEYVYTETDSSRDMGVFRIGETPKYQGMYRKLNLQCFPLFWECLCLPVPIWITPSVY